MNLYLVLNFCMLITVLAVLVFRYKRTGVAATPLNMFLVRSVLMLFVTYPFFHLGLTTIRWSGFIDILRASEKALLVCSLGTTMFLLAFFLVPYMMRERSGDGAETGGRHLPGRPEISEAYAACLLMFFGCMLIWFTFAQTGTIPFLTEQPSKARTFSDTYEAYAAVRPLYQMGNAVTGVSMAFASAWCLVRRRSMRIPLPILGCLGFTLLTLLLTANRGWVLNPLLQGAMIYYAINWRQARPMRLLGLGCMMIVLALGLQMARTGQFNKDVVTAIPMEFAAGNTFSDFRDFSWLLTEFDRKGFDFYYGKTIAAGLLGFVPSSLSPFRHHYTWGRVTADIASLDPESHFGLRPGPFGEWYFNFGWPGVIVQGLLLGTLGGLIDRFFIRRAKSTPPDERFPGVYRIFIAWNLFSIICGPLVLSSDGPRTVPRIAAILMIMVLASLLRSAGAAGRELRMSKRRQKLETQGSDV